MTHCTIDDGRNTSSKSSTLSLQSRLRKSAAISLRGSAKNASMPHSYTSAAIRDLKEMASQSGVSRRSGSHSGCLWQERRAGGYRSTPVLRYLRYFTRPFVVILVGVVRQDRRLKVSDGASSTKKASPLSIEGQKSEDRRQV